MVFIKSWISLRGINSWLTKLTFGTQNKTEEMHVIRLYSFVLCVMKFCTHCKQQFFIQAQRPGRYGEIRATAIFFLPHDEATTAKKPFPVFARLAVTCDRNFKLAGSCMKPFAGRGCFSFFIVGLRFCQGIIFTQYSSSKFFSHSDSRNVNCK